MERLLKVKKTALAIATVSLALGVISVFGAVLCSLKLLYIPLILCVLFAAYAAYGCPFYFLAYANAKLSVKIFRTVAEEETYSIGSIAAAVGIKEDFARTIIGKTIRKEYIRGFSFDGENLIKEK